jgi:hypothetical protein
MTMEFTPAPPRRRSDSLSIIGVVIACGALIFAVIGVGLSFEKLDKAKEVLAGSTPSEATVTLSEFKISPDSGTATYAQAACLRVHAAVLSKLSGRITPLRTGDDPWERIARELEAEGSPSCLLGGSGD